MSTKGKAQLIGVQPQVDVAEEAAYQVFGQEGLVLQKLFRAQSVDVVTIRLHIPGVLSRHLHLLLRVAGVQASSLVQLKVGVQLVLQLQKALNAGVAIAASTPGCLSTISATASQWLEVPRATLFRSTRATESPFFTR